MININNIIKCYGDKKILNDISFGVQKGEVVALVGPSGSGKSTIIRCINGLEIPDSGNIIANVQHRYEIATVFQAFNLFANMTVLQNLCYAPRKVLRCSTNNVTTLAIKMLALVGLEEYINCYPHRLSGGQKQRVAIARALCMQPKVILFDEPTSALDPENVKEVLDVIKQLVHTNITNVIATHEMRFAKAVADRVIFLENGNIVENSPTAEFFSNPTTQRAREFLDKLNF
ncbi:putative ABC transporter ATP-binding protein PEB1C [Alphaproteobacteria bacterium]